MKRRRELSGALALSLDGSAALEPPARRRAQLTSSLYARSFAHHAQQLKHRGCVNALALSPRDARWFASGGDDMRTLVYRANDDFSSSKPVACFHGPRVRRAPSQAAPVSRALTSQLILPHRATSSPSRSSPMTAQS